MVSLGFRIVVWTNFRSAGVILYECLFGKAPFSSDSIEQVIKQLLDSEPIKIPPENISKECRNLLESTSYFSHYALINVSRAPIGKLELLLSVFTWQKTFDIFSSS